MNKTRLILSVLSVFGFTVAGMSASPLITYDLRVSGTGAKSATVQNIGDTVTLSLYAIVYNGNSNGADDKFFGGYGKITSTESGTSLLLGDLSTLALSSELDSTLSSVGALANLDSNSDLELGSTNPSTGAGWIYTSKGATGLIGSASTTGNVEFYLGDVTWTVTSLGTGTTSLQYALRNKTDGSASTQYMSKFATDGVSKNLKYNDANIAYGDAVVITAVPEPMTLAMLAMGGLGLLRRKLA